MNPNQVWLAALGELEAAMTSATFETWVKNTIAVGRQGATFTIAAPNTFAKEWLDTRFRPPIEKTLSRLLGQPTALEVIVEGFGRGRPAPPRVERGGTSNDLDERGPDGVPEWLRGPLEESARRDGNVLPAAPPAARKPRHRSLTPVDDLPASNEDELAAADRDARVLGPFGTARYALLHDAALTDEQFRAALLLGTYCDRDRQNWCYDVWEPEERQRLRVPETLGRHAGWSRAKVFRILRELRELGYVLPTERRKGHRAAKGATYLVAITSFHARSEPFGVSHVRPQHDEVAFGVSHVRPQTDDPAFGVSHVRLQTDEQADLESHPWRFEVSHVRLQTDVGVSHVRLQRTRYVDREKEEKGDGERAPARVHPSGLIEGGVAVQPSLGGVGGIARVTPVREPATPVRRPPPPPPAVGDGAATRDEAAGGAIR